MTAAIALAVSIVALVIAGLSARYSRDQARSSASQAASSAQQTHAEATPDIAIDVAADSGDTSAGTLEIRHDAGPDLESVEIEIVVPGDATETLSVPTFGPGNHTRMAKVKPLRQGATERRKVIVNRNAHNKPATFRLTCRALGQEPWTITRRVAVRWPPRMVDWTRQ